MAGVKYARPCFWRLFGKRFHAWMHNTNVYDLRREWCMLPAAVRYKKSYIKRGARRLNEHANGYELPPPRFRERTDKWPG